MTGVHGPHMTHLGTNAKRRMSSGAHLPASVAQLVRELVVGGARSVWLIGSRANNCAADGSDWDLLVFQAQDPIPTTTREPGVDVLRVGPSGKVLLDGQSEDFAFAQSDLEWVEDDRGFGRYKGKRFVEYPEMQSINTDASRFHRPHLRAQRLWPTSHNNND